MVTALVCLSLVDFKVRMCARESCWKRGTVRPLTNWYTRTLDARHVYAGDGDGQCVYNASACVKQLCNGLAGASQGGDFILLG